MRKEMGKRKNETNNGRKMLENEKKKRMGERNDVKKKKRNWEGEKEWKLRGKSIRKMERYKKIRKGKDWRRKRKKKRDRVGVEIKMLRTEAV